MPRGYPSTTCYNCHRYHVPCIRDSPDEPCKKCKHRGVECVVKPHKVYRGPGKKKRDSLSSSASGVSTSPATTLAQTQAEFPQAPVEFDSSWMFPSPVSPFVQTSLLDFVGDDSVSPSEVPQLVPTTGTHEESPSETLTQTHTWAAPTQAHTQTWAASTQAQNPPWTAPTQAQTHTWVAPTPSQNENWAAPTQAQNQTWAASTQSQNQTWAASTQSQNQTWAASTPSQNQALVLSTQVQTHAFTHGQTIQDRARAAPEPQRWLLSNFTPLHGIKEKEILAGFPEFPLFQAMQHEAEVIFDKYRNKRPTIVDPAKVDVGFLELLRNKAQGLPLAKVPDLSVIAMYVSMRSVIHAMGTFFHDLDDETLLVFFRAYLTPPKATFTDHDVIRRHGFGFLVRQKSINEPDFATSRDIAAAVDKDSAREIREVVLHRFRTIEYHANLEGFICILSKVYNAGVVHKVLYGRRESLLRIFQPFMSRDFELNFASGIINELPEDIERNPLTFDLTDPRFQAIQKSAPLRHRLIRDEYLEKMQCDSSEHCIEEFLQMA